MSSLLGIDLGTSSVKVVSFAVAGVLKGVGMAEYPILTLSAVESKPASWGRIKTSHFFPINRSKMFWQEADLRFFEQWR